MDNINWEDVKTKVFFWDRGETGIVIHWEVTYKSEATIIVAPPVPYLPELVTSHYLRESFHLAKPFMKTWLATIITQDLSTSIVNQEIQWNVDDWMN